MQTPMRPIARRSAAIIVLRGSGETRRRALFVLLLLLLAACAPREVPPQLAYTPGPAYTLTIHELMTEIYTVETPPLWRVIAGPAEDPYTFQFVSPENDASIVLSDHPVDIPPAPLGAERAALAISRTDILLNGRVIYVVLISPPEQEAKLAAVRDAVVASLR